MFRTLFGFAVLAIVGIFLLKFVLGLFGFALALFIRLLVWAAFGFGIYVVIKILSPSTAGKIRETVTGKP